MLRDTGRRETGKGTKKRIEEQNKDRENIRRKMREEEDGSSITNCF